MAAALVASGPGSVHLEPPNLAVPSEQHLSGVEPTPVLESPAGLDASLAVLDFAHFTLLDYPCGSTLSELSLSLAGALTSVLHDGLCASTKIRTHVSQFIRECLEDIEAELPHIHPPAVDCWEWDLVAGPLPVLASPEPFAQSSFGDADGDEKVHVRPRRSSSWSAGVKTAVKGERNGGSRSLRVQWLDEARGAALTDVREFRRCDHEAAAMGYRVETCSREDVCSCSLQ